MTREEALKIVRENYPHFGTTEPWLDLEKALSTLIPELKESEDERIMDTIIEHFKGFSPIKVFGDFDFTSEQILAYLEKIREKSLIPDELVEGYKKCGLSKLVEGAKIVNSINGINEQKEHQNNSDAREKALGRDYTFPQDKDKNLDEIAQDYVDRVKEYNPEPTWNLMQTAVCYGYHCCEQKEKKPGPISCGHGNGIPAEECYGHKGDPDPAGVWKPSEEQMSTLALVIDEYYHACTKGSDDKSKTLKTLFEQLKKL